MNEFLKMFQSDAASKFVKVLGRNIFLYDCDTFTRDTEIVWENGGVGTKLIHSQQFGKEETNYSLPLLHVTLANGECLVGPAGLLQGVHGL